MIQNEQTIKETRERTVAFERNVFSEFNHENKVTEDNNVHSSEKYTPVEKPVLELVIIGDAAKIENRNTLLLAQFSI